MLSKLQCKTEIPVWFGAVTESASATHFDDEKRDRQL